MVTNKDFDVLEVEHAPNSGGDNYDNTDDDDDGISSTCSTSRFTGDEREYSSSEEAMLRKALQEGKYSTWAKILLLVVLLSIAACVTTFIYYYTSNAEQDALVKHFGSESDKFFVSIGRTLDSNFAAADSFMYRVVSQAHATNSTWPYVTIPDLPVAIAKLISQTKGIYLTFYPLITKEERPQWEEFASQNDDWVRESLRVQSRNPHFHGPILEDFPLSYSIWRNEGPEPENATGPFTPSWMGSPVIPYYYPYNWNPLAHAEYADGIWASLNSVKVVMTPLVNDAPPDDPDAIAVAEVNNDWAKDFIGDDAFDEKEPFSDMYFPIYDSVHDVVVNITENTKALGVIALSMYWRHSLYGIIADGASAGVVVVFRNPCGDQVFTYLIDGQAPTFLGFEDLSHSIEHHDLCESRDLPDLMNLDGDYTGRPMNDEFCTFQLTVCPSRDMENEFITSNPLLLTIVGGLVFFFLISSVCFLLYGMEVTRRQKIALSRALRAGNIVSDMFPAAIRERLMKEDDSSFLAGGGYQSNKNKVRSFLNDGMTHSTAFPKSYGKPIADIYPDTTIMFADVASFTPWSSTRDPTQVFLFLQTIYQGFDEIAKRRHVFKVETVGDSYVAACGVPNPSEKPHAVVMAHFAEECLYKFNEYTRKLEVVLGPDTGDLKIRIGMHSGPCTAGVLRGERARFQLFGNTVNMAARMESHGIPNRIQLSKQTADLLISAGKERWIQPRGELVHVKGKGVQETFWLVPQSKYATSSCDSNSVTGIKPRPRSSSDLHANNASSGKKELKSKNKTIRLIEWNVHTLSNLLKPIVARRRATRRLTKKPNSKRGLLDGSDHQEDATEPEEKTVKSVALPLEEVQIVIKLPTFDAKAAASVINPDQVVLSADVMTQLHNYVTTISTMYHDNPFHNFEHASHVASSVEKLLKRIVAPDIEISAAESSALGLHDYTYGITSDPLTQFAVVFSALIHDVDHRGVSNQQLGVEMPALKEHYKDKSVAEQNSIDCAWELLMTSKYKDLRNCIYGDNIQDQKRFRQIVVAVVLATDIFDKELNDLRKSRWMKAFSTNFTEQEQEQASQKDFRATIVIEHLIQASDVSHTMQHWHIYRKWNERLFVELLHAYQAGRMGKDPSTFWYQGEIGFFDNYIIPLAKKLKECNVFGVSSDEYLNYAIENRDEWCQKGEAIVADLKQKYCNPTMTEDKPEDVPLLLETLTEEAEQGTVASVE